MRAHAVCYLALDDAGFKEGDHPRDASGKFSTAAGGGATASPATVKAATNYIDGKLGGTIVKAGFKKTQGPDGVITYAHPSGAKVMFHLPAEGKKFSSKWTHSSGETGSGMAITKLLGQAVAKAEEKAPAQGVGEKLKAAGFMLKSSDGDTSFYEGGDGMSAAAFNYATQGWIVDGPKGFKSGVGSDTLTAQLAAGAAPKPALEMIPAQQAMAVQKHVDANGYEFQPHNSSDAFSVYSGPAGTLIIQPKTGKWAINNPDGTAKDNGGTMSSLIETLNAEPPRPTDIEPPVQGKALPMQAAKPNTYNFALSKKDFTKGIKTSYGTFLFSKDNGATVEVDSTGKKWLAKSPGHLTKEGEGKANLEALLDGKPVTFQGAGNAPWKNSPKASLADSTHTPAEPKPKAEKPPEAPENVTHKMLAKAAPKLDVPGEQAAVHAYTDGSYQAINKQLRHGDGANNQDKNIKHLDAYLAKSEFPEDVELYRKVSGEYSKVLKSIMVPGARIPDRGFISTSTHKGTWSGDLQMVISVKKGQKGASVKAGSSHSGENEVMLPRNTMFVVKKFDREANVVHVELDQSNLEGKDL